MTFLLAIFLNKNGYGLAGNFLVFQKCHNHALSKNPWLENQTYLNGLSRRLSLLLRFQYARAIDHLNAVHGNLLEPVDWNIGEFFILAKFQSSGVGSAVAREIFTRFPGKWSVAAMPENVGAVNF
jgi:hypothetical protein